MWRGAMPKLMNGEHSAMLATDENSSRLLANARSSHLCTQQDNGLGKAASKDMSEQEDEWQ